MKNVSRVCRALITLAGKRRRTSRTLSQRATFKDQAVRTRTSQGIRRPPTCLPGRCVARLAQLEPGSAAAVYMERERRRAGALYGLTPKLCLHFHFWSTTGCHETQPDSS